MSFASQESSFLRTEKLVFGDWMKLTSKRRKDTILFLGFVGKLEGAISVGKAAQDRIGAFC